MYLQKWSTTRFFRWIPTESGIIAPVNHFEGDFEESYSTLIHTDFSEIEERYGTAVAINFTLEECSPAA